MVTARFRCSRANPAATGPSPTIVQAIRRRAVLGMPLVLLGASACSNRVADLPPAPAATDIAAYRLGPGDRITVAVFGEPALSGDLVLDGLGRISVPFVGDVEARGLTVTEVEDRIEARLRELEILRDPQVRVAVTVYRPYFVLGEVRSPGAFPYAFGTTLLRAVAQAGGYTYRADQDAVILTREETGEVYRAGPTTPILPGDIIEVTERFF